MEKKVAKWKVKNWKFCGKTQVALTDLFLHVCLIGIVSTLIYFCDKHFRFCFSCLSFFPEIHSDCAFSHITQSLDVDSLMEREKEKPKSESRGQNKTTTLSFFCVSKKPATNPNGFQDLRLDCPTDKRVLFYINFFEKKNKQSGPSGFRASATVETPHRIETKTNGRPHRKKRWHFIYKIK